MSMPEFQGQKDISLGRGDDVEFGFDSEMPTVEIVRSNDYKDASALVAEAVTSLVKAGTSVSEAAEAVGMTVEGLKADTKVRRALKELKAQYELGAEELKALVKAKATKLAVEGDDKVALDACKFLGQMPDVGLTQTYAKVNVAVGVFSDETKKVLSSIDED
jgi:hypothetical protein